MSESGIPLIDHSLVVEFIGLLSMKNVSSGTIKQYRMMLKDLFGSLEPAIDSPEQVTAEHLRRYMLGLQERKLCAKTITDRRDLVTGFFGFLVEEGYIRQDPCKGLPSPQIGTRLPKVLNMSETRDLLAAIRADTSSVSLRDRTLFLVLYGTAFRINEALSLRVEDIDFTHGTLRVIGKGDRERVAYLKQPICDALKEYLKSGKFDGYLFPGRCGKGHVTDRDVRYRLCHYAAKAGLRRKISPHTLRHSVAVHYLRNGAPVSFVQALLGHASLATTGIYLQLTDQMAKEITMKTEIALEKWLRIKEGRLGNTKTAT